jgi:hypothetical protein
MENALSEGTITIDQKIKSELPFGLRVDVVITRAQPDKPYTYTYTYSLDTLKFKEWLEENKYLCEGALAFTAKGIQVVIPFGAVKWNKSSFSIDNDNGEQMYLDLLNEDVVIYVHRDLFAGKEWEILLNLDEGETAQPAFSQIGILQDDDVPF